MGDSERQYSLPSSEAHEKPKVGGGITDSVLYSTSYPMVSLGIVEMKKTAVRWWKQSNSSSSSFNLPKQLTAEAFRFVAQCGYQVMGEIRNIRQRYSFFPSTYHCILTSGKTFLFVEARLMAGEVKLYHSAPYDLGSSQSRIIQMFKKLLFSCYGNLKSLVKASLQSMKRQFRTVRCVVSSILSYPPYCPFRFCR